MYDCSQFGVSHADEDEGVCRRIGLFRNSSAKVGYMNTEDCDFNKLGWFAKMPRLATDIVFENLSKGADDWKNVKQISMFEE